MMTAYQPQPGAMHPGMAHGHPAMTPGGGPMNPAQMQQMGHPGVSGPGQPHVTQAGAMMGIQPGANGMGGPGGMGGQHPGGQMAGMPGQMGGQSMAGGAPNAHALSHLTPQAHMQQQQQQLMQQQMQNNPQMAMQARQQAMLRQHQQQRLAQLQQQNGVGGMQQGGMQGMTPAQIQQLQQNSQGMHPQSVQLPQHLQMQQLQLQMQQQQQQAQQAQQNQHNQQMQQQLAMQHANSQQSNQGGQPGAQNQPGGQPQNPGQMRPQSRMANPNEHNSGSGQQTPGPQPQQQQQQNQPGQQGQQQGQQSQSQQQLHPQQLANLQRQQQMQQRAQQMQQQNAMQQRIAQQQPTAGACILKMMQFCDNLCNFNQANGKQIDMWQSFVDQHFSADGKFQHTVPFDNGGSKAFEVLRPTIARYFQMYFDSGASHIQLHTMGARESPRLVQFMSAVLVIYFPKGMRLELSGSLSCQFAQGENTIERMELTTLHTEEIIDRAVVENIVSNFSPTMSNKTSPKMAKKNLPKAQQKMQQNQPERLTMDDFPKAPKGTWGVTTRVQHFLEIHDTMGLMADLMVFAQEKKLRPEPAMEAWLSEFGGQNGGQQGNPQINLPPNGIPAGNRTPSMQHMQMPNAQGNQFSSSPSVSNLGLPMQNGMGVMNGSPSIANNPGLAPNMNMANSHTPSPHMNNMAAPPMVPQHSQQGTNSSAASTNTSPNVNNKRRRSTVKMEGDEGGGEANTAANRVKPSPRMGKKGKPGGA